MARIDSTTRAVLWAIHGHRCVYSGAHLFDPAMMEVDHIIAKDVFNGPDRSKALQAYGVTDLESVDDLRNVVPIYGPLNTQKGEHWDPAHVVHLRAADWRRLNVPPPLGVSLPAQWALGGLIRKGIAAARARHDDVLNELAAVKKSEGVRDIFSAGAHVSRVELSRELGPTPASFPVVPAYEVEGMVRSSSPGIEAAVYLPRYPKQQGYGWIRFSRPELRDLIVVPSHKEWIRLLRPRTGGLPRWVPGTRADGTAEILFGWVGVRLHANEIAELESILAAIAPVYAGALTRIESELLRVSRFPYGPRGYRIVEMEHDTWQLLMRFAAGQPTGPGPHASWRLEQAGSNAIRVVPRVDTYDQLRAYGILTSSWLEHYQPPAEGYGATLKVALDWQPHPPYPYAGVYDDNGDPSPAGLWTGEQIHDWIFSGLAPEFAHWLSVRSRPIHSGPLSRWFCRDASADVYQGFVPFRSAALPVAEETAPFGTYTTYMAAIRSLASRVSPNPGFLRVEHEIGVYQHLRWCVKSFDPPPGLRNLVWSNFSRAGARSLEEAIDYAQETAARSRMANAPAVQYGLAGLWELLKARPVTVPEDEILGNAAAHLYSLMYAATANQMWRRFDERSW